MKPFTPPRNALNEGLNGGSDDDNEDHLNQNKSVYPESRANAAQARLRRTEFRSKDKLVQAVESMMHVIEPYSEEDESKNCSTKKMKLGDGSAALPAPPPCPPSHPPPSPPPPPPSPPSSPPPATPPPPPEEDAS